MKQFLSWTMGLVLIIGLLAGCGGQEGVATTPPTTVPPTPAASPTPEVVDYTKYNQYLRVLDEIKMIEEQLNVYFSQVDYHPEFALLEGGDYGAIKESLDNYYFNASSTIDTAVENIMMKPSYPKQDSQILKLEDPVEALEAAMEEIYKYCIDDQYLNDDLIRAPELHRVLYEAVLEYDNEIPKFYKLMQELEKEVEQEGLDQMLTLNQKISYYASCVLIDLRDMLEELKRQGAYDDTTIAIDMTTLDPLREKYEQDLSQFQEALQDPEQQEMVTSLSKAGAFPAKEQVLNLIEISLSSVKGAVNELYTEAAAGGDLRQAINKLYEARMSLANCYNNMLTE